MSSSHLDTASSRKAEPPRPPVIVKHPGCPQWGFGLLVEERDDKRIYDFEDGQSHSIAKPFWSKIESVALEADEALALEAKIKSLKAKPDPAKKPRVRTVAPPSMTWDEQVARFEALFPGGFLGEAFTDNERGGAGEPPSAVQAPGGEGDSAGEAPAPPATRGKKSKAQTRNQAIATARELLGKSELLSLVAAGNTAEVIARVRRVHQAAGNLLHPLGDLIPFSKLPDDHQPAVAEAIVALLHGEGDFGPRFDRFVEVLAADKLNTWPLATVLSALSQPDTHVFVKPSFYEKQAAIVAYDLGYDRLPSAAVYERMRGLCADVEQRLRAKGHAPRDRMDVYAFIWRTTAAPKKEKEKEKPAPRAS